MGRGPKKSTVFLCMLVVSIPAISLYIGYVIGIYFMPPVRKYPERGVIMDMAKLNYSWYNTHNVTIDLNGGLGNQMFQYASMYGIAKANGLKALIGEHNRVAKTFPHLKARRTEEHSPGKRYKAFWERHPNSYDSRTFSLNFMNNIMLEGFYQSWRYFSHVRNDVKKQFTFSAHVHEASAKVLTDALLDIEYNKVVDRDKYPVQFIGVHVRRADYLADYNTDKGYTVADEKYFHLAMQHFREKLYNVIFVVCSDDREWSENALKSDEHHVVFSPYSDQPILDLCLLSQCNHSIISVGTFGWWGAWLAGGETIYYKNFPKPNSALDRTFKKGDYYLPTWIAV